MKIKLAVAVVAASVLTVVAPASTVLAGFGPANRATFTCSSPSVCEGANYVAFNSFTNAPNYGDERAFFDGKDATNVAGAFSDVMNVQNNQELHLRIYVHNNANPATTAAGQAVAKNTTVKVQLPKSKSTDTYAVANIFADNAKPGLVNDTLTFRGSKAFTLEYVTGSAQVERRLDGKTWTTTAVSDSIVTEGANLGDWKGCFEYSGFVTLRVKVKMDETPVVVPNVVCEALTAKAVVNNNKKISYTAKANATNGAVVNGYSFDFGDGNKADSTNATVEHEYAKAGTYKTTVVVKSSIGNTAVTETCTASVTISEDKPPVVPPTTPKTPTTPTTVKALPETGAGSVLAAFLAASGLGTLGYYILGRRSTRA